MSDDFKATRNAYAQGYERALWLGMMFAVVVVALFAALVITNPLGISYHELHMTGRGYVLDCWRTGPDPDGYGLAGVDCVEYLAYKGAEVTAHYFVLAIVFYAVLTFLPSLVAFFLLFDTSRRMRQLDIIMAAQKTLGLLDEGKKE